MALEGFQVTRTLAGRARASTSARAALHTGGVLGQIGPIPGVEVHVALCYYPEDSAVARYDLALYDTPEAVYAEAAPCDDVSCQVRSYTATLGRDLPLERFRAGTASIVLDDPDGLYSPWRTSPAPGTLGVRPGIDVEVWVETETGIYPRFAGRVVAIVDEFPDPTLGPDGTVTSRHEVRFDAADYMSLLAVYDGVEQSPVGAGETSGARISRICDTAAYTKARRFDAGTTPLQATTLAKNALDEAGMVCDTELGVLFCDGAGVLVHRDVNGLVSDPRYTDVQATFGEQDPELCYTGIALASDTDKVKNVVSIANEGGTAVTVQDTQSQSLYGPHTYRRYDLIHEDPAQSTIIANRHLDFYAYAADRIETLTVTPHVFPDQLDQNLALGLLDRIEVRRRAEGFQAIAELQIQGIRETIDPHTWTIDYTTFSADAIFDVGRYDIGVYDEALYGY